MPTLTLPQAESLVVAALTRASTSESNAQERRPRAGDGGSGRAEGSRPVARADVCRAGENRKSRRPRHADPANKETRAGRDRCHQRLRLSGDRARRNRCCRRWRAARASPPPRSTARIIAARPVILSSGLPTPDSSRSCSPTLRRRSRHGAARGRVRHQSDRIRLPAARPRAARDRPVALEGRARQHHGGEAARRENPGRLGARRRGPADHRSRTRRSPAPWCRWAMPRAPRSR